MSKPCVKCAVECVVDAAETVCCAECGDVQHVACAGLNPKRTKIRSYKCDKCKDCASGNVEEGTILKAIHSLKEDLKTSFDKQLTKLEDKINATLQEKIQVIDERISSYQDSLKSTLSEITAENSKLRQDYDALKLQCGDLSRQVDALNEQLQDLQQYSRIDNLEIVGVPLTKEEDVYAVLKVVADKIKVPWRREDVSVAHRLPAGRQKHPNIIVRFTSRSSKMAWLLAARKLGKLTANMLHSRFPDTPVFINEHLAAHLKATLSRAKHLVREKGLAFAWVKEGKVLVKKTPDGRTTRMRSVADVEAAAAPDQRRSSGGVGNGVNTGGPAYNEVL